MKIKSLMASALLLSSCGPSPDELELERLRADLAEVNYIIQSCHADEISMSRAGAVVSNYEVDMASAENIDNISPEQVVRIKLSLASQLGIGADQVDWKAIYRARSAQAEQKLAAARDYYERLRTNYLERCSGLSDTRSNERKLESAVRKLERKIKASG